MSKTNKKREECGRCGKEPGHTQRQCPARDKKCKKCNIIGHFAVRCRTKQTREVMLEQDYESDSSEPRYEMLEIKNIYQVNSEKPWRINLKIGVDTVIFKLDTGADESILSYKEYSKEIKKKYKIKPTNVTLLGPGNGPGKKLKVYGKIRLPVQTHKGTEIIKVYVADTNENLLGRPALQKLNIVQWKNQKLIIKEIDGVTNSDEVVVNNDAVADNATEIIEMYPELFGGLGKLKNFTHTIKVNENTVPYAIGAPRRVPLPLLEEVKKEIQRMVKQDVIEKVDEPSSWCAPMVIAQKKNGKVRVCSDLTELNKFVKRERYQLPSVEETLAKLQGAKVFSKLDFSCGFWQLELAVESRELTTFITPFGRYRYKRIPFGITSAPEVFQKTISNVIDKLGLNMVHAHADDILVTGKDLKEHNVNLQRVLKCLVVNGLTLNKEKCEFNTCETTYLGYIVGKEGIKIDPKSVEAIEQYPVPTNVSEVRKFLGIINYVAKFIPNVSKNTQQICELLRNDNQFIWTLNHQRDFETLKSKIMSAPVLAMFDTNLPTRVSADASSFGIGAVLEQYQKDRNWKPVYFCSKTLSPAERRYAQIEKEALAVTWACERLEQFLLGAKFQILTDHKPLTSILATKEINKLSNRLQRFRMRLLRFDYSIDHVPGEKFWFADALSRAPLKKGIVDTDVALKESDIYIDAVISEVDVEVCSEDLIRKYQKEDNTFNIIQKYVTEGWPEKKKNEINVRPYFQHRNELTISNDLLCYKDRIVIPPMLRKQCLKAIHEGHMGINKCLARTKSTIWWPGINSEVEDLVTSCEICIKHRLPVTEPMIPVKFPNRPWEIIGADLATYESSTYLVVQDYYSKYVEIRKLKNQTSKTIIEYFKDIYAHHGIPNIVRSDNGRQFDSFEFRKFAKNYGFQWISSSPNYQQSNGQAESAVKIVKTILKKNKDPYLGLLSHRNTPLKCGASPAELLFGRKLKEKLPIKEENLLPKLINHGAMRSKMIEEQEKQKRNFDKRHQAREMEELNEGERVWIIDMKREGRIKNTTTQPRSYIVEAEEGTIRRNRKHLHVLPEKERDVKPTDVEVRPRKEQRENTEVMTTEEEPRNEKRKRKPPTRLKDYIIN